MPSARAFRSNLRFAPITATIPIAERQPPIIVNATAKVASRDQLRQHKPLRYLYAFADPSWLRQLIINNQIQKYEEEKQIQATRNVHRVQSNHSV